MTAVAPHALCRPLIEVGVRVNGFAVEHPSLEDTFVVLAWEGFDLAR